MFNPGSVFKRCRNPRCKTWLKGPVENRRDAFCCAGCEAGFYHTHCRVCEKALGDVKRNSRRELCGRRQCQNRFRSFRHQFFSSWYPSPTGASKPEKSSTKSRAFSGIESDRPRQKVAGSDLVWLRKDTAERTRLHKALFAAAGARTTEEVQAVANKYFRTKNGISKKATEEYLPQLWQVWKGQMRRAGGAPLIGPNDPPVNILGGYKFPGAPNVNLKPDHVPFAGAVQSRWSPVTPKSTVDPVPTINQADLPDDLKIPDDLSIPPFLRRTP